MAPPHEPAARWALHLAAAALLLLEPACRRAGTDAGAPTDSGDAGDAGIPPLYGLPALPIDSLAKLEAALAASRVTVTDPNGPASAATAGFGVLGPDAAAGPSVHALLANDGAALAGTIWSRDDRIESYSTWQLWSPDVDLWRLWIDEGLIAPGTEEVMLNSPIFGVPGEFGIIAGAPRIGTAGNVFVTAGGRLDVEVYEPPAPGTWGRLRARLANVSLGLLPTPDYGVPSYSGITGGAIGGGLVDVPLVHVSDLLLPPRDPEERLSLVTEVTIDAADADVWGAGDLAFVASNWTGSGDPTFHVVDLAAAGAPTVATVLGAGQGKELKFWGGWLFVAVQPTADSVGGVRVYDVSTPSAPAELPGSFVTSAELGGRGVHNLWVENGFVYATAGSSGIEIWDSSTPTAPAFVAAWTDCGGGVAHDVAVVRDRAYLSCLGGGLFVLDVADPSAPALYARVTYAEQWTHNAWPTEDDRYVLTTDEYVSGTVRVFDLVDPLAPVEVTRFASPRRNAVVHNVFVVGTLAYASYFIDGVEVWDVADPTTPARVAWYDTVRESVPPLSMDLEGSSGVWGIWPFGGPDRIYLSDSFRGLLVLSLAP